MKSRLSFESRLVVLRTNQVLLFVVVVLRGRRLVLGVLWRRPWRRLPSRCARNRGCLPCRSAGRRVRSLALLLPGIKFLLLVSLYFRTLLHRRSRPYLRAVLVGGGLRSLVDARSLPLLHLRRIAAVFWLRLCHVHSRMRNIIVLALHLAWGLQRLRRSIHSVCRPLGPWHIGSLVWHAARCFDRLRRPYRLRMRLRDITRHIVILVRWHAPRSLTALRVAPRIALWFTGALAPLGGLCRSHRFGANVGGRSRLLKRSARRRDSRSHHLPVHDRCRRTVSGRRTSPKHAASYRLRIRTIMGGSCRNLFLIHPHEVPRHRPRIYERIARDRRHRIGPALIHVRDVGGVHIGTRVIDVVNVSHLRDIHPRVRYIYMIHIAAAGAVPRHINFAGGEREPGDTRSANADGELKPSPAHESYQSGCVNGPHEHPSRNPEPPAGDKRPAPVVERRKAPRFILYPGPAPGRDPNPVPVAVRGPIYSNAPWSPAGAIPGLIGP